MRRPSNFVGKFVGFVDLNGQGTGVRDGKWYCVQTEPRREELAHGSIASAGLISYLPRKSEWLRSGRASRLVDRPMFPDYLFVCCQPEASHWNTVCLSRGVQRILGRQNPVSLHDDAITAIRLFEAKCASRDQPKRKSNTIWKFTKGDLVRITKGPFSGFYSTLTSSVDRHDRVRALIIMLGRSTNVDISAFDVESTG